MFYNLCKIYISPLSNIFIIFKNLASKLIHLYCSTFTRSKISASAVVVCAMVTRISATFRTPTCRRNWSAAASITLAGLSVQHVARVSNRKNGDNPQRHRNSYANVKTVYFLSIEEKSLLAVNSISYYTNNKSVKNINFICWKLFSYAQQIIYNNTN